MIRLNSQQRQTAQLKQQQLRLEQELQFSKTVKQRKQIILRYREVQKRLKYLKYV